MEFLQQAVDIFLHLDLYLADIINQFGLFTYLILFLVIFCETGLVVTPFLPGDSLLFAAGALAAKGHLNMALMFFLLWGAAILGDTVNYAVGAFIGPKTFTDKLRLLKKEHLERTHRFYEKHGGKTIILARFLPIIRTVAPFVAGIGRMEYKRFVLFNVTGGLLWVGLFLIGGYLFGNIPLVEENFTLVILAIIVISLLPGIIEYLRFRFRSKRTNGVPVQ